jgi:hypothetical protein
MFAVIGVWEMEPLLASAQQASLPQLVAGVRQAPGLVKGYWTADETSSISHTFILFSDRQSAESFAAIVRGNVENQARAGVRNISLDLTEVSAET